MRKCNNCSITLGDGDSFCPQCGMATVPVEPEQPAEQAQPEQAQPEQAQPAAEPYRNPAAEKPAGKKKKTGLIIGIIAACALLAVAAIVIVSLLKNKPMVQFYNAQNRFMTTKVRGSSIEDVLRGKTDRPATDISTDAVLRVAADGLDIMGFDVLDKFDISFNIDTRGDEDLFGVGVNYKGSPVLTGSIKSTENDLYCYLPELSDEYYVIDRNMLFEILELDIDSEPVDYEKVENLSRAYDSISSRYEAILRIGVAEEDFTAEKGAVRLGGLDINLNGASTVVYRPNKERLSAMLAKLGGELKTDEALSDYLLSLIAYYSGDAVNYTQFAYIRDDGSSGDMMDMLRELGEQLEEKAEEIANDIVESEFEWRCVTDDGSVVAQYLTSKDFSFSLERPDDLRSFIEIRPKDGEDKFTVRSVLEKTGSTIDGEIRFNADNDDMHAEGCITLTSVDENKKSALGVPYGSYKLGCTVTDAYYEDETTSIDIEITVGANENGGTEHRLTVNGLRELTDDEEMPESITVFLDTTDKESTFRAPDAEPTRIDDENEFQEVIDEFTENLSTVIYRLMLKIAISGE